MQASTLRTSIAAALGLTALAAGPMASAGVLTMDWTGYFIMLDSEGNAMGNNSLSAKTNNQYVTPISGTLSFDDLTGAGTATVAPFDLLASMYPATVVEFGLQAVGDGMGGDGSLVLGNLLFDWGGNNGIPVSLVMDAAGLFAGEFDPGGPASAVPASDGTYIGQVHFSGGFTDANGYLALGPMPMVTTAWNTSFGPGCSPAACMAVSPSGILPLVYDTAPNLAYDGPNDGGSIGGNPMADGPFLGSNINIQFASFTPLYYDPEATISPYCDWSPDLCVATEVPLPAAAWLLGSGLLGLLGAARRRKPNP